jgi:ABC-2 type transport system ATP-binding protein
MSRSIHVSGLSKTFGTLKAVNALSFSVESGQVLGFIGANGAGKTTAMRMMCTLELPDEGFVEICGCNVVEKPVQARRHLGWMPDAYGCYSAVSVWEYLDFFGRAYGFRGAELKRRVDEVMGFTALDKIAEQPSAKLSKGQKQRLCLGRTLIPDPEVLILDEPAAGLDPKARIEFKNLVRLLAENGKTLFISSHILSELEEMCDSLLFIDAGSLVHHGSSENLKHREGAPVLVRVGVDAPLDRLAEWVTLYPGIECYDRARNGNLRIRVDDGAPAQLATILRAMLQADFPVCEFHREDIRLEDAFVDMLSKTGASHAN